MIAVVTGGRSYEDRDHVFKILDQVMPTMIFHGGCSQKKEFNSTVVELRGVDRWADEWAKYRAVPHFCFPADWDLGLKAGPMRNRRMVTTALGMAKSNLCPEEDARLLAFPGGKGTDSCKRIAEEMGMMVLTYPKVTG